MTDAQRWQTYKNQLYTSYLSNCEQFDKAILTLAAGGLGISLTLVKSLFVSKAPVHIWALYWAWLTFSAAIIFTLISFLLGQSATNKAMGHADEQIDRCEQADTAEEETSSLQNQSDTLSAWTEKANILSATLFVVGVLFTVTFAISNTNVKDTTSKEGETPMIQRMEEGTKPHSAPKPSGGTNEPIIIPDVGVKPHSAPSKPPAPQPKPRSE